MNWKEIKEKYPKAWKLARGWHFEKENVHIHDNPIGREMGMYILFRNPRRLYDFFDENEIFIGINPVYMGADMGNKRSEKPSSWEYMITTKDNAVGRKRNGRSVVETEAFTKAFEILEQQL
jgi:hypothetical protein